MTFYLSAATGAAVDPPPAAAHLPSNRVRCYPSDMDDDEWAMVAPLIPVGGPQPKRGGHPVVHSRRDIVDAIRYVSHNGGVWRAVPRDFPPWRTVYGYHRDWKADGTVARINAALREQVRVAEGRNPEPTAAIVDSQSVRAAETVAKTSRGYDAGKKVNGRKRHLAVDTCGLLLAVLVTTAGVQDRDAARMLLWAVRTCFPSISLVWADGGYAGQLVTWAATTLDLTVQIVRKIAAQVGFVVLPRRWVVERTLSWITRYRRTVRDYERLPAHHAAFVEWSMIIIMTRRLARHHRRTAATPNTAHAP